MTLRSMPATKLLSSEARKSAPAMISSGQPNRVSGILAAKEAQMASEGRPRFIPGFTDGGFSQTLLKQAFIRTLTFENLSIGYCQGAEPFFFLRRSIISTR
jgi:hypothetical protein